MILSPKILNKNYKGNVCKECCKPISIGSKSGFCKYHSPKKIVSELTKAKISHAMLGNNRALGSVRSPETRKLMSVNNGRWNKGLHMPKEYRLKLSLAKQGERHPNWQGGKSSMNKRLRATVEYKEWRLNIFKRDDHTCVECGSRGVNLHADHIKPFAFYPELRFDITNGRTLCVPCHKKTDSYFWKANKKTYRDTLTKTE